MKKIVGILSDHKYLSLSLALISAAILAFAYISQYVFHYSPCILCLYQRKPYFAVIILSLLAFAFSRKKPQWAFYLLLLCVSSFLIGSGIALYHTGVELEWWKGTQACGDDLLPRNASVEELRQYLTNKKVTRCDVPSWMLFGLSMTNYNLIQSVILAAGSFHFTIKGKKA